jgi:hypothetical protein
LAPALRIRRQPICPGIHPRAKIFKEIPGDTEKLAAH